MKHMENHVGCQEKILSCVVFPWKRSCLNKTKALSIVGQNVRRNIQQIPIDESFNIQYDFVSFIVIITP